MNQSTRKDENRKPSRRTTDVWLHRFIHEKVMQKLGLYESRVVWVLFQHANGRSCECFPSLKTIAKLSGIRQPHVCAALKSLAAKGIIKTTTQGGGRKQRTIRTLIIQDENTTSRRSVSSTKNTTSRRQKTLRNFSSSKFGQLTVRSS